MINFLHLSALLSLTLALCLQRNAKKMNGANISPSFYSFFIFFSIFVFILLLLPSFPFLPSFLSFFPILSFSSSCYFFLLSVLLVFIFVSLCLSLCSYSHSSFSVPPFSVPPFSEECDLQQKFHIDNVKHLPKFYAHFLKARFLFET